MPAKRQLETDEVIDLPNPRIAGKVSVEEALQSRRSVRSYSKAALTPAEVGQLLWAAQGMTRRDGGRTAPSAGALYPLEVYLVVGEVESLAPGIYKYRPRKHALDQVAEGDRRGELAAAALDQDCLRKGAAAIVIAGVCERTARKYGERADRYVHLEAGHAVQNMHLQAVSLQLGTVEVGAFDDERIRQVMTMERQEQPLAIMPFGRIK
jgi:SagB-type dehydrogenase family enzyme